MREGELARACDVGSAAKAAPAEAGAARWAAREARGVGCCRLYLLDARIDTAKYEDCVRPGDETRGLGFPARSRRCAAWFAKNPPDRATSSSATVRAISLLSSSGAPSADIEAVSITLGNPVRASYSRIERVVEPKFLEVDP